MHYFRALLGMVVSLFHALVNVLRILERFLQSQLGVFFQGFEMNSSIREGHYSDRDQGCLVFLVTLVFGVKFPCVCRNEIVPVSHLVQSHSILTFLFPNLLE